MSRAAADLPEDPAELRRFAAALAAEVHAKTLLIEKLRMQLAILRRARFGRSSEKLDREIEQLELLLGDMEESDAERQARTQASDDEASSAPPPSKKPSVRAPLPDHLPLETVTHEAPCVCPACGETKFGRIGADERMVLEYVPSHFKRVLHVRPKMSCRACETIVQAPMPTLPIEKGRPGPALLAHVLVSKYCDHLPLHRQSDIYARSGVEIDRSVMAGWVGHMAALLEPLAERIARHVRAGAALHADDTPVPVLDPGRGRTKTGRLWTAVRDERPYGSTAPPAAFYLYSPDRKAEHAHALLRGCRGHLHADAYAGFAGLYEADPQTGATAPLTEAFCRVGGDVASPAPHRPGRADYPHPVLHAQGSLRWRRTDERAMETAGGVARAWHGSATTTACCGGRDGQAIFSRYARPGGDTNVVACCFPRRHSRRSAPGSFATGGRAVRGRAGANCADTIPSRPRGRACNGLSPLSGARRPCPSRMFPKHG